MSWRLIVVMLLLAVVPLFILRGALLMNIQDRLWDERINDIEKHSTYLSEQIVSLGYFDGKNRNIVNSLISQLDSIYNGRVVVVDDSFIVSKDSYARINNKTVISEAVIACISGEEIEPEYDELYDIVEVVIPITDDGEILGAIIIDASVSDLTAIFTAAERISLWICAGISILLLGLAILFAHRFTRPFHKLSSSINRIAEGHFDEEVHLEGYAEIEMISDAFNVMLSRLKAQEDSRQEFVSNVSHELKTPLTSMKVLADSLNTQSDVPVEVYREFMQDIAEEIDRENEIINDLLSLVKMDKTAGELNISTVNINELLELVIKRLRPIAAKRNIELAFESFRTVYAECDETKLTLAFTNLAENGIKYNSAGGWVQISLDADHKYFYVKVADSGIGIPEAYQDKIFDRFFRVDKARSRETGGTGLGLAITKNIILAHDGAIKVRSKEDAGTTFTVRIPLQHGGEG